MKSSEIKIIVGYTLTNEIPIPNRFFLEINGYVLTTITKKEYETLVILGLILETSAEPFGDVGILTPTPICLSKDHIKFFNDINEKLNVLHD